MVSRPWESEAAEWIPTRIVGSAWRKHAPFAAWLIDAIRPDVLVELGTHNGFSFFTFCEAAQRADTGTTLYAVDTWRGDDHSGFYGEHIFEEVSQVRDALYPNAQLLRGTFDEILPTFTAGQIDVLHIDGRHGYDDVKHDYTTWLPKVTDDGVVLFHDIAVTTGGFEVHAFWEELTTNHPGKTFAFHHGYGLGILTPNRTPEALLPFVNATEDVAQQIREHFTKLGEHIH
jgi:hypothetical protein